jgi:hypothetical protein
MAHRFTVLHIMLILRSVKQRRRRNILKCKKDEGKLRLGTDCQTKPVLRSQTPKDRNHQNPHTNQVLNIFSIKVREMPVYY